MRVLFLTHRLPFAPNRGDRVRAYHVLRALAAQWEVDLVSFVHDRQEEAHAGDLLGIAATVTAVRVRRAQQLGRVAPSLLTGTPLTHALLAAREMTGTLETLTGLRRPAVVLAYCSGMARFAFEPPLDRLPLVLDLVDVDSEKWAALAETARAPLRWVYRRESQCLARFETRAATSAFATLVVNERERTLLHRLAPRASTFVVENGVDASTLGTSRPPATDPRVVFCGVMDYRPNVETALWLARVWPEIRLKQPDARLVIVGSHPTAAVRHLAVQDPSIEVTGTVADVRPYLWNAAISVAPLATARGIQNKVLEAIAAGLPVVVSSAVFGGVPAAVAPACVVADTPDAFVAAVLNLLSRPAAERRALTARADLGSLTWTDRLAPLHAILKAAAGRTPQRAGINANCARLARSDRLLVNGTTASESQT